MTRKNKIHQYGDHIIYWQMTNDRYPGEGELSCSCGKVAPKTVRIYSGNRPYKGNLRAFVNHAKEAPVDTEDTIPETPILIGRIQKGRVEHEVWIFHFIHDFPPNLKGWMAGSLLDKTNAADIYRNSFYVLYRNSRSWKVTDRVNTYARALSSAHYETNKEMGEIIFDPKPEGGIPSAPSTVQTVVADLIKTYKTAKTISRLQEGISAIDKQLDTIYSLQAFRNELSERMLKATGLDLE